MTEGRLYGTAMILCSIVIYIDIYIYILAILQTHTLTLTTWENQTRHQRLIECLHFP